MSYFNNILRQRDQFKHDGRSLWKYNLSDDEFFNLKQQLVETRSSYNLDYRDCALYYSEWWRRCYNGGLPSKKEVFDSIAENHLFTEEEFYRFARKGANLLGIRWIRNQNTLYFKTLLLQGGLPIKHLSNHKGAYKSFLLAILQINPKTIDDFAFESRVTSLLPMSSRNDEIYECCLDIVKAIINEDSEYLSLLDNNDELKEISKELRVKKQSLSNNRKKTKYSASWILVPCIEKIRLHFRISDVINSEDFKNIFLKSDSDEAIDFEYTLFYNDLVLCKFNKRSNNTFRTAWINQHEIFWDGTAHFPELKLRNSRGIENDCKELINYIPKLDKPTLWTKYTEEQWLLEKGCHTAQDDGYVLMPLNYKTSTSLSSQNIKVCGQTLSFISFSESIALTSFGDTLNFKTSCKKIDWFIIDEKPKWMQRTNISVVRRKPKVFVYDETGNLLQNHIIKWRQNKNLNWNSWNGNISTGLIEVQIQVFDIIETDYFFNIGDLDLEVVSNRLHFAEVTLINNQFSFDIYQNPFIDIIKQSSNKIKLHLKSNTSIPESIHASIKNVNQSKSLSFEIYPPFRGIEVIDSNQNIIENNVSININKLNGYRLMSNQENLVVNMYNTHINGIIISEYLTEKFIPLRSFEEKIKQLYRLSDSMDNEAEIVIEISEERNHKQTKIKEYKIKRYNYTIESKFDETNNLLLTTNCKNVDLLAVPLDCMNNQLHLYDLESREGSYSIKQNNNIEKFIVFNSKDSTIQLQPAFISLNPNNKLTTPEDRVLRVMNLVQQLLEANQDSDVWQRLLSYYKICQNQDLLFSTFDILRAIGFSSELSAKAFVFLLCYDETQLFVEEVCAKMEQDLGFSFHWTNKKHWEDAMEWMGCFTDPNVLALVGNGIKVYFDNLNPATHFLSISNFIMQGLIPTSNNGFHLNAKIIQLRSSLGDKVLSQLPKKSPKIPEKFKEIIPVNETTANVKILLKSPLSVALSITGADESLWNRDNEEVRRYVRYSQQLNPEWYSEAINYCITKITA